MTGHTLHLGRKAYSEGSTPTSPDSGYGSRFATPSRYLSSHESFESYHISVFDGNGSSDFADTESVPDDDKTLEGGADTSAPRPRLTVLTAAPPKTPKPTRRKSDVGPARISGLRLRTPDRFVPSRDTTGTPLHEKFRFTRLPHELTDTERRLRHSGASPDVFCYPGGRHTINATPSQRGFSRSDTLTLQPRTRARTILGPVHVNHQGFVQSYAHRDASAGSVWSVGGVAPPGAAVHDGHGNLIQSGTNATMFVSAFGKPKKTAEEDQNKHEGRLAAALGIDLAARTLETGTHENTPKTAAKTLFQSYFSPPKSFWNGAVWVKDGKAPDTRKSTASRTLTVAPFRVLDAPHLRDDFYCSVLAYSPAANALAIGLGNSLYRWSEAAGVKLLNKGTEPERFWLTSVAFSSAEGGKSILAFGRNDCSFGLMSLDSGAIPRMTLKEHHAISSLCWKPRCTLRFSKNPRGPGQTCAKTEDLLVGDDSGCISYYAVEWPETWEVARDNWRGEITLMVRIKIHQQQICGLSWSANGEFFASSGNDNLCCLFDANKVLERRQPPNTQGDQHPESVQGLDLTMSEQSERLFLTIQGVEIRRTTDDINLINYLSVGAEKHRWLHGAAVKAIAFCPWQEDLVATGGGSNDKCIHFFHATSGAALATIAVQAQVTSLIWSTTRREIAATFGYAIPEHPVRVAVFSWPDCKQVAAISWDGKHRALSAVAYPRAAPAPAPALVPNEGSVTAPRPELPSATAKREASGCIVIATSDESIKFHEVWPADARLTVGSTGILGGSDILEELSGIDREGDIIR